MMIYAIKDDKFNFETGLVVMPNDEVAKRNLPYFVEGNDLHKRCPNDFGLYCVGDFDYECGSITPCSPRYVCSLADWSANENLA